MNFKTGLTLLTFLLVLGACAPPHDNIPPSSLWQYSYEFEGKQHIIELISVTHGWEKGEEGLKRIAMFSVRVTPAMPHDSSSFGGTILYDPHGRIIPRLASVVTVEEAPDQNAIIYNEKIQALGALPDKVNLSFCLLPYNNGESMMQLCLKDMNPEDLSGLTQIGNDMALLIKKGEFTQNQWNENILELEYTLSGEGAEYYSDIVLKNEEVLFSPFEFSRNFRKENNKEYVDAKALFILPEIPQCFDLLFHPFPKDSQEKELVFDFVDLPLAD